MHERNTYTLLLLKFLCNHIHNKSTQKWNSVNGVRHCGASLVVGGAASGLVCQKPHSGSFQSRLSRSLSFSISFVNKRIFNLLYPTRKAHLTSIILDHIPFAINFNTSPTYDRGIAFAGNAKDVFRLRGIRF